jgi:hypothetical protein
LWVALKRKTKSLPQKKRKPSQSTKPPCYRKLDARARSTVG